MISHRVARSCCLAVLFVLALTGCGQSTGAATTSAATDAATTGAPTAGASPASSEGGTATFPVTVSAANGDITLDAQPRSIVSLSATATEMLFAIGAGDQVVAVDEYSTYPSDAPTTDLSGLDPNVEAVAGYEPDLVVIADDGADLTSSLADLDIPVLVEPAARTLDDSYDQIHQLGTATGHDADADALATDMQAQIDKIAADAPTGDPALTYYHELDDTFYSVTSRTFIGQIYDLAGLRNIADDVPDDAGGYPQLSSEFIVDADPDLIFLADTKCCGQSAKTVARRPGWKRLTAVRDDGVIELDDDIASRWGPRVVDLLRTVVDAAGQHARASRS